MINFERHLKNLLYDHDFFIFPGIGAFIASFTQNEQEGGQKTFSFNGLLNVDIDNKFLNYIVNKENLPKSEVENQLNDFIHQFKKGMEVGEKKELADVCTLTLNANGNFDGHFNSIINYYQRPGFEDDSSSISPVILEPSQSLEATSIPEPSTLEPSEMTEEVGKSEETTPMEEETVYYESDYQEGSSLRRKVLTYGIPLLIAAGVYYYLSNENNQKKTVLVVAEEPELGSDTLSLSIEDSLNPMDEEVIGVKTEEKVNQNLKPASNSQKSAIIPSNQKYNFEVAAGIFKNNNNAQNLLEKMKKAGFSAEIRQINDMRRVYVGVNTAQEAEQMSKKIEQFTGEKSVYFDKNGISNE